MNVKKTVARVYCLTNRNYPTLANCQIYINIFPHPPFEFLLSRSGSSGEMIKNVPEHMGTSRSTLVP